MKKIILAILSMCAIGTALYADARPNPRGGSAAKTSAAAQNLTGRNTKEIEAREISAENSRSNRSTANRGVIVSDRITARSATAARGATASRSASAVQTSRSAAPVIRSSATAKTSAVARSAVRSAATPNTARSASPQVSRGRAAATPNTARATALFTNMSSMGEGYNQCREAYFACMDQFCGTKSDVYRRCLCSGKFREFKDREDAFDEAKQLIVQFNDNNLRSINLTAAEVSSMYSQTAGEAAMQKDTSASMQLLNQITDLLSGKSKASAPTTASKPTTATLDLNFSSAVDDIWGDSPATDSIFSSNTRSSAAVNVETLEGSELYDEVHKQCMEVSASCKQNQAQGNMVVSAYTVLISQDCTAYERKLDSQKAALESTIHEADNAMKDARLDEYRARNSADFNACIAATRQSVLDPNACGADWARCLDFSGKYINPLDGEIVPTAQLFELKNVINLNNMNDAANAEFLGDKGLEKFKNRARAALNTCVDDAEEVWSQFKQQALIEIAQSQDRKIESIKNSCLTLVSECYDTQTGQAKNFGKVQDDSEMSAAVQSATAALGQRFARSACSDKVSMCAALYAKPGDPECQFNDRGELLNSGQCGMQTLLAFVDTVDNTKITLYCKKDLESYVEQLCSPGGNVANASNSSSSSASVSTSATSTETSGPARLCNDYTGGVDNNGVPNNTPDGKCSAEEKELYLAETNKLSIMQIRSSFPYECRKMPKYGKGSVYEALINRAKIVCMNPDTNQFDSSGAAAIKEIMSNVGSRMAGLLQRECEIADGGAGEAFWVDDWTPDAPSTPKKAMGVSAQYVNSVFGSNQAFANTVSSNLNIQFGGTNGVGTQTLPGGAAAMPVPSPALDDVSNNLAAKGWGACEVGMVKDQCEIMNTLIKGRTDLATYNPTTRQCEFSSDYYQVVCENFLLVPSYPGTAQWDPQNSECRIMPQ